MREAWIGETRPRARFPDNTVEPKDVRSRFSNSDGRSWNGSGYRGEGCGKIVDFRTGSEKYSMSNSGIFRLQEGRAEEQLVYRLFSFTHC